MESEFESLNLDSIEVANAIRSLAKEESVDLNMTKIHKLLYVSYGLFLAKYSKRLTKEFPHIWPFGPVFPRVHSNVSLDDEIKPINKDVFSEDVLDIIRLVLRTFGKYSASKLSAWSHLPDSPWDKTVKESDGKWNIPMKDSYIKEYFSVFVK